MIKEEKPWLKLLSNTKVQEVKGEREVIIIKSNETPYEGFKVFIYSFFLFLIK